MSATKSQKHGLDILCSGRNAFITGGAGVGKTWLVNEFVDWLCKNNKSFMLTAPTGIAAMGINGVTINRAFEIPIGALTYRRNTYSANDELLKADVVIIEEISMCRIDVFDFIANKILDANERRKRQGKENIQLVVVGDFFQLPPVITERDRVALDKYYGMDIGLGMAFQSKFWKYFNFYSVVLDEVMRQSNYEFIHNLNLIRTGNKAYIHQIHNMASKQFIQDAINICGTNNEVNTINTSELSKLPGNGYMYLATYTGDADDKDVIADKELVLKVGARIMTLVNTEGYKNGSLGTVEGLYRDGIVIRLDNGVQQTVVPFTWDVFDYKIEKDDNGEDRLVKYQAGTVTQLPVKLAYAITIHKSQGQTYEKVNISPYCWECGQMYVALSRVKSVENLYFTYSPDHKNVIVSLNIIKFYNTLFDNLGKQQINMDKTNKEDDDILKISNLLKGLKY